MASTTLNRPNISADPRAKRYGDYNTTIGHGGMNNSQNTSNGQGNGQTNPWKTNTGIWGTGAAIGSGYTSNRRDVPRSQYDDEDILNGPTGSSALSASSEADPWSVRPHGSWKISSSGPNSGETSPSNHRGSDASVSASGGLSESQKSSPYLVNTSRRNAGQGYGNRGPVKSNLDPSTGSFKYSYATNMSFGDNKENGQSLSTNGVFADQYTGLADRRLAAAYRASQAKMAELSFTSSKSPDNAPSSMIFTGNPYAANNNPLPNNDNAQRQNGYGNNPQMAPNDARPVTVRRGYSNDAQYASGSNDENFQNSVTESPLASSITSASQYSPAVAQESTYSNSCARSRAGDRTQASQFSNARNHGNNYNTAGQNSTGMPTTRAQQAQDYSDLERSLQRLALGQQQQALYANQLFNGQFQGQYPPQTAWEYTYPVRPLSQIFHHYPVNPLHNFSSIPIPRGPSRDTDIGHGVRSLLLEEFRNNTKSNTRRYELKDIYGFVVEFSGDQHGSRFIQQKLETANSDEKEWVFREILPNALQLMTDVFGNYVVQKCFEHGSQVQKRCLGGVMRGRVMELSLQMYGCRVVQKALEHVLAEQQAALVRELKVDVLRCVKDQNGNHVIQKAIERCSKEHVQFILDAFRGNVHTLATHPYGCRVIQRMLEYCSPEDQASILDEFFTCAQMLIIDQYGNYVVQHVIQHGNPEHRAALIRLVTGQLHTLSKHKFASNVVERSFVCGSGEEREAMVRLITEPNADGSSPLDLMMKDQYGNYIIQKILTHFSGTQREAFIGHVQPHLAALRKFNAGKQLAAIEKLIFVAPLGPQPPRFGGSHGMHFGDIKSAVVTSATATATPNLTMSTTPTPQLTTRANSPQSSGMPSAALSLVDGIDGLVEREVAGGKLGDGPPTLEIRVEQV